MNQNEVSHDTGESAEWSWVGKNVRDLSLDELIAMATKVKVLPPGFGQRLKTLAPDILKDSGRKDGSLPASVTTVRDYSS